MPNLALAGERGGHRGLQSSTVGQNRVISAVVRPTIKNDVKFGIEEGWIKIAVFFQFFNPHGRQNQAEIWHGSARFRLTLSRQTWS